MPPNALALIWGDGQRGRCFGHAGLDRRNVPPISRQDWSGGIASESLGDAIGRARGWFFKDVVGILAAELVGQEPVNDFGRSPGRTRRLQGNAGWSAVPLAIIPRWVA